MRVEDKALIEEKAKRKALSKVRIFWFLVLMDVVLIIYIIIQIMILANQG